MAILRNLFIDVWVMFLAGVIGYMLRTTGYSAAGVVLGLILGGIGESAFAKSMQLLDYQVLEFFQRPIAATLLILSIVMLVVSVVSEWRQGRKTQPIEI